MKNVEARVKSFDFIKQNGQFKNAFIYFHVLNISQSVRGAKMGLGLSLQQTHHIYLKVAL